MQRNKLPPGHLDADLSKEKRNEQKNRQGPLLSLPIFYNIVRI